MIFCNQLLRIFIISLVISSFSECSVLLPELNTAVPFAGVLLSIAFFPLLIPSIWHKYENFILIFWLVLSQCLCFMSLGWYLTEHLMVHVFLKEYLPFVILIGTLYIISGGINIKIERKATTKLNILVFLVGEILANFIGTTGTSVVLLRPLIEINKDRKYKVHTIIFFIFLVSNIGGCLLPFGDPPLFLGYLKGVSFFWTLKNMFLIFLCTSVSLLLIYYFIDKYFIRKEKKENVENFSVAPTDGKNCVKITGLFNIGLMIFVVLCIAFSGNLPEKQLFVVVGSPIFLSDLVRDSVLLLLSFASYKLTPKKNGERIHKINNFSWGPMKEVSKYFSAIFLTMAPVSLMLKGGHEFFEPIRQVLQSAANPGFLYFWFVSPFSAFLDNAPTYLIFFKIAGGDANFLMNEGAQILKAISASSVFMGAMTYIGNAPNFMVKAIAKQDGVEMPSFVGYMLWSAAILLPVFAIISFFMF